MRTPVRQFGTIAELHGAAAPKGRGPRPKIASCIFGTPAIHGRRMARVHPQAQTKRTPLRNFEWAGEQSHRDRPTSPPQII
jgi:hypothetical protein